MMSPDEHESEQSSPEPSPSATRDLLANERTLLAWARTGVAIMGLGFVVARFGLAIRQLTVGGGALAPRGVSTAFGVALVLSGALLLVLATIRCRRAAPLSIQLEGALTSRWRCASAGALVPRARAEAARSDKERRHAKCDATSGPGRLCGPRGELPARRRDRRSVQRRDAAGCPAGRAHTEPHVLCARSFRHAAD